MNIPFLTSKFEIFLSFITPFTFTADRFRIMTIFLSQGHMTPLYKKHISQHQKQHNIKRHLSKKPYNNYYIGNGIQNQNYSRINVKQSNASSNTCTIKVIHCVKKFIRNLLLCKLLFTFVSQFNAVFPTITLHCTMIVTHTSLH